jgi:hypothetical protein
MAYIGDDENRPAWGHSMSVQPLAASGLGGDGAARQVEHEAYAGRLIGGDLSQFK